MPGTIGNSGQRPPGDGLRYQDGGALVGDRIVYRDQQMWLDGFVVAVAADMAYVAVLNMPSLAPLPLAALRVVERGALVRTLQLQS